MTSRNPWIGVMVALVAMLGTPSVAAQGVAGERDLKAAIIYKLAKFVQRPDGRPTDSYTIGVLGDAELAKAIEKTVKGNHWNDPHDAAVKVVTKGLKKIGLLDGSLPKLIGDWRR